MSLPEIVSLRERDLPAAAAALSRAFHDDPLQTYVFPDPVERAARSPALFTPLLRYGLLFGEVLTTAGGPVGAAVWLGPAAWEVTPERAKAAGLDELPTVLGAAAAERFLSVLAAIDPYHHRDVPPAHWYVMVVGVAPEAQGTGIGQALLRPMIDIVVVFSNGGFDWDSRKAARTARSIGGFNNENSNLLFGSRDDFGVRAAGRNGAGTRRGAGRFRFDSAALCYSSAGRF